MLWFVNNKPFSIVDFIADVLKINFIGMFHNFLEGCLNLVRRFLTNVGVRDLS